MLVNLPLLIALECARIVFSQCPSSPGPVTITGDTISDNAYHNCGTITSLEIPSTVTSIGDKSNYYIINNTAIYYLF